MSEIVLTEIGKSYINKQLKGPSFSLVGFVPFYCKEDIYNKNTNKATLIADAMSFMFNKYYFNGIDYVYSNKEVVVKDENDYINLFDLITTDNLYKVKYTNTKTINDEDVTLYNINLNIDDINICYNPIEEPKLPINAIAIFIQSNVVNTHATSSDIELFAVIKFDEDIDLVKKDINWSLSFNNKENFNSNNFNDVSYYGFELTEKPNVYSASEFSVSDTSYTFTDNYHDNAKTLYYSNDYSLGFVKGGLNDYQYDLTLLNNSSKDNAFYFNLNPRNNTLEMQGSNRESNIAFGDVNTNFSSKDSFIIDSKDLKSRDSRGLFAIDVSGEVNNTINAFIIGDNTIENSFNSTIVGEKNIVNSSNSQMVVGDNNYVSGDNVFVAGDNNSVSSNDSYVFGSGINVNCDGSVSFGYNYNNGGFAVSYSNGNLLYGLEKEYGNFVISGEGRPSVQFSKDSIFLNKKSDKVNPHKNENSLSIGNENTPSKNSMFYGSYWASSKSLAENSLVIPSAINQKQNGRISDSYFSNSLIIAKSLENASSYNSVLGSNSVSSTNGLTIYNSFVEDFKGTSGNINNSIVLSGDMSGKVEIDQSLVLTNNSKVVTSGEIINSIIQGNTQNSTFKNSHLIGNLPEGVNRDFVNCLVIADGKDWVALYADEIVKRFEGYDKDTHIKWKHGALDTYIDEECARGKECVTDSIDQDFENKIKSYLFNIPQYYNECDKRGVVFVGEIKDGKTKATVSLEFLINDFKFILNADFDLTNGKVYYTIDEYSTSHKTTYDQKYVYVLKHGLIEGGLTFSYKNNKIAITSKFYKKMFVLYRMCTCDILDTKDYFTNGSYLTAEHSYGDVKVKNTYLKENNVGTLVGSTINADTFNMVGNYTANVGEVIIKNDELSEDIRKILIFNSSNMVGYTAYGFYNYYGLNVPIKYMSINKTYEFTNLTNSSYTYDFKNERVNEYVSKGKIDVCNAVNNTADNRLQLLESGINIKSDNFNVNKCEIGNLFVDGYDDDEFVHKVDSNYYLCNLNNLTYNSRKLYTFIHKDEPKVTHETTDMVSPIYYDLGKIEYGNDLFSFLQCVVWGKCINFTIFTESFKFKNNTDNKIRLFNFGVSPATNVVSFVEFGNSCELYHYNCASYTLNKNDLTLNIHRREVFDTIGQFDGIKGDYNIKVLNPFLAYGNGDAYKGKIRHEMTFLGDTFGSFYNVFYQKYKSKLENVSDRIIRLGDYYYT